MRFLLFVSLNLWVFSSYANECGKINFGGILNSNNSPGRILPRRLTFARQNGKILAGTKRVWNTYVSYDLDDATLDFKKIKGDETVKVTVCIHDHEKDPGNEIESFRIQESNPNDTMFTRNLNGLFNKYVSIKLKTEGTDDDSDDKYLSYEVRLKRPTQGQLWRPQKYRRLNPVSGYADLHNHQASELGHGGSYNPSYVHGKHDEDFFSCDGTHARLPLPQNHKSYPSKNSKQPEKWWPHYADGAHLQTHISQLKEAYDNNMRLMLVTAVSNQALCIMSSSTKYRIKHCDDMDSAKEQIKAFHEFDRKYSWYKIVRDPWEARQAILENKMAIVIGIEVSNLMPKAHGNWRDQLDELYDMGVRSIEIAHEADSRFSGNAHQHGRLFRLLNGLKRFSRPLQQAIEPMLKYAAELRDQGLPANFSDLAEFYYKTRNPKHCDPEYRELGMDCNKVGLTYDGEQLIEEFINKKMFIPLDHVSRKARKEIFEISKKNKYYPLFASHTRTDEIMHPAERQGGKGSHEYMLSDKDLGYIVKTGGMIGLRTGDNAMTEVPGCINQKLTCWGSAQSLSQNLCWASTHGLAVALGTDFAGPVVMTSPQYNHDSRTTKRWDALPAACPRNVHLGLVTPFGYKEGFEDHEPVTRTGSDWEYAVRGLAHTGFTQPLIEEMRSLGAPVRETKLSDSAESFLRMWQRIYKRRRRELSNSTYQRYMGTSQRNYQKPEIAAIPDYDHKLAKLYTKCAKLKEKGSKKCDSLADWNKMVLKHEKELEKCPVGRQYVAYENGILYCEKIAHKAIKRRDCESTDVDGISGVIDQLEGYCSWNQDYKIKQHHLVRRFEENKCPRNMALIKARKNSTKPFCKMLVASPIKEGECADWGGNLTTLDAYCIKDEGDYFHGRKLFGFNKLGEKKCPSPLKKKEFDINDDRLFCVGLSNGTITSSKCTSKHSGNFDTIAGYCAKEEEGYTRLWRLKGFNYNGERKCQSPYYKVKVEGSPEDLYCQAKPASPISEEKCLEQEGVINRIRGYCAFDKGDWFHIRKLKGHNQAGETKCPVPLTRVDLIPGSGIKFCRSVGKVNLSKCEAEDAEVRPNLSGFCQKDEEGYVRVWQLIGFDSDGDQTFKCPSGLWKVTVQNDILFCKQGVASKITPSACSEQGGSTSRLSGYCSFDRTTYQFVRPLDIVSSLGRPTCPSGYGYETRNPLNKDRCKRVSVSTRTLMCNLLPSDISRNWTGPHAQSGKDECRSTKGKNPKGVKCPIGYKLEINNGADRCTKTSVTYQTPTCPSGSNYKSQAGTDECIRN